MKYLAHFVAYFKDHIKRKVDTNRLVSEIHQKIWKFYLLLDSPNVHPQLKKFNERRQISAVNDVFRYSLNTDNLGWILPLWVRQQAKKAPDACWQHETRKIIKFELLFVLVMTMTWSLILVL